MLNLSGRRKLALLLSFLLVMSLLPSTFSYATENSPTFTEDFNYADTTEFTATGGTLSGTASFADGTVDLPGGTNLIQNAVYPDTDFIAETRFRLNYADGVTGTGTTDQVRIQFYDGNKEIATRITPQTIYYYAYNGSTSAFSNQALTHASGVWYTYRFKMENGQISLYRKTDADSDFTALDITWTPPDKTGNKYFRFHSLGAVSTAVDYFKIYNIPMPAFVNVLTDDLDYADADALTAAGGIVAGSPTFADSTMCIAPGDTVTRLYDAASSPVAAATVADIRFKFDGDTSMARIQVAFSGYLVYYNFVSSAELTGNWYVYRFILNADTGTAKIYRRADNESNFIFFANGNTQTKTTVFYKMYTNTGLPTVTYDYIKFYKLPDTSGEALLTEWNTGSVDAYLNDDYSTYTPVTITADSEVQQVKNWQTTLSDDAVVSVNQSGSEGLMVLKPNGSSSMLISSVYESYTNPILETRLRFSGLNKSYFGFQLNGTTDRVFLRVYNDKIAYVNQNNSWVTTAYTTEDNQWLTIRIEKIENQFNLYVKHDGDADYTALLVHKDCAAKNAVTNNFVQITTDANASNATIEIASMTIREANTFEVINTFSYTDGTAVGTAPESGKSLKSNYTITATAELNSKITHELSIFSALYATDSGYTDLRFLTVTRKYVSMTGNEVKSTDIEISIPDDGGNYLVKSYLWQADSSIKPICGDYRFPKYYADDFTVASIFSNNAVLQHGEPLSVWGKAPTGKTVTVTLAGNIKTAQADSNGNWMVENLGPVAANETCDLTAVMEDETIIRTGLVGGDVFLCSGQSNMVFPLSKSDDAAALIADSENPNVRVFQQDLQGTTKEHDDTLNGAWYKASPDTAGSFTAVGYLFAKELQADLNIPVGIITAAVGGSCAEHWTSKEALLASPLYYLYYRAHKNYLYPQRQSTRLFNGMIAPLIPYKIKGVVWYQGESNADMGQEYRQLLGAMLDDWRARFNQNFPFIYVQVAPYSHETIAEPTQADFRQVQTNFLNDRDNLAMVLTMDAGAIGTGDDIHPTHKPIVAHRVYLAAKGLIYGDNIIYKNPLAASATKKSDGSIEITFSDCGTGLKVKDGLTLDGRFQVCGEDGIYVDATAVISSENTVTVTCAEVTEPVSVAYCYENYPDPVVSLYNSGDLPVPSFKLVIE